MRQPKSAAEKASRAAWRIANPEKRAAQQAAQRAVLKGEIQRQPCERCGTRENIHAHHDDYNRPLDVMWLCPKHHRQRHVELRAAALAAA